MARCTGRRTMLVSSTTSGGCEAAASSGTLMFRDRHGRRSRRSRHAMAAAAAARADANDRNGRSNMRRERPYRRR